MLRKYEDKNVDPQNSYTRQRGMAAVPIILVSEGRNRTLRASSGFSLRDQGGGIIKDDSWHLLQVSTGIYSHGFIHKNEEKKANRYCLCHLFLFIQSKWSLPSKKENNSWDHEQWWCLYILRASTLWRASQLLVSAKRRYIRAWAMMYSAILQPFVSVLCVGGWALTTCAVHSNCVIWPWPFLLSFWSGRFTLSSQKVRTRSPWRAPRRMWV